MMKISIVIIILMLLGCTGNNNIRNNENVGKKDIVQNGIIKETSNLIKKRTSNAIAGTSIDNVVRDTITQKTDGNIILLKFNSVDFPFYLAFFIESERKFLYKEDIFSFELYAMLYENAENLLTGLKDIQIVKGEKQYFLMYPTYSEEFPSFKIVGFSKNNPFKYYGIHTYGYNDYDKLEGISFEEIKYRLFEENNIPMVYALSGRKKFLLSQIEEDQYRERISEEEKNRIKNFMLNLK